MRDAIVKRPSIDAIGFIHFSCFCGHNIYCVGNNLDGSTPYKAIDEFQRSLEGLPAALFTSEDGALTTCPACGIEMELPSSDVLDMFARRSQQAQFDSSVMDEAVSYHPGTSKSSP